jgi:thiamine phosphate synthase YjbQ (UPF0047 family)
VRAAVADGDRHHERRLARARAGRAGVVRVNEREAGFFEDLEDLLERLVPLEVPERERTIRFLLGPRTEQIPFREASLCLGRWQRVLLLGFDSSSPGGWTLTTVG